MDVHLYRLAAKQDNIVAVWQPRAAGWSRWMVEHRESRRGWQRIHDGVYSLSQARLTQRQRWWAAALTAQKTFLAGCSAAGCYGFHAWDGPYETVVRPGSGGRRMYPGLLVARSTTLVGQTGLKDGIPIVSPERALVDIAADLGTRQLGRAFRESIRLHCTTANEISRSLAGQR